jgi:heat shock protein HslJ
MPCAPRVTPIVCVAVAMLIALIVSGCGASREDSSSSPARVRPWGKDFVVTSIRDTDRARQPISHPGQVSVSFTKPKGRGIGWEANCNGYGATLRITDRTLKLTEVGSTLVECLPRRREQEDRWLADFFEADPQWHLRGAELTLSAKGKSIRLEESG